MPLPIKQYKHMFKDVKFLATTAQPSYREVSHWIDLLEDPTGGTIKVWNGASWEKISGEDGSDTGLVIGDTTGTAYDGGKGKELETAMDEVYTTTNELQDSISSLQTEIQNKKIFQFSYTDLQNKTTEFLTEFREVLTSGQFNPPTNVVFLYRPGTHNDVSGNYNLDTNLLMSVQDYEFSLDSGTVTATLISSIYQDNNGDDYKITKVKAVIDVSGSEVSDENSFTIEEIPTKQDAFNVITPESGTDILDLTTEEFKNIVEKSSRSVPNYIALSKDIILPINIIQDNGFALMEMLCGVFGGYLAYQYDSDGDVFQKFEFSFPIRYVQDYTVGYNPEKKTWNFINEVKIFGDLANYVLPLENTDEEINTQYGITTKELNKYFGNAGVWVTLHGAGEIVDAPAYSDHSTLSSNDLTATLYAEIPQIIIQKGNLTYKYIDIIFKRETTEDGVWIIWIKYRKDALASESGITDAPSDGKTYGRKDSTWTEITTPDTSTFATKDELATKADLTGAQFTGNLDARQISLSHPTDGAMFSMLPNSRDITFRTLNAGIDSMNFQVQSAIPLKITEAGIFENGTLLSSKYADIDSLYDKQDVLVSGTNIKTINNQSLLGEGNIDVATGDSGVYMFSLSEIITDWAGNDLLTGTLNDGIYSELTDAINNKRCIIGCYAADDNSINLVFNYICSSSTFLLYADMNGASVNIKILSDKSYQAIVQGRVLNPDTSGNVLISDIFQNEFVTIISGGNPLKTINVNTNFNGNMRIYTSTEPVSFNCTSALGYIGAEPTEKTITLDANSLYEINIYSQIVVVAKVNQAS